MQSYVASLVPMLMMPLPLARPVLTPRPCSPIPVSFLGFVHVLQAYPEKLMRLPERLPWSLGETAHPRGLWEATALGCTLPSSHRNSGCNSTASCENTRLLYGDRLLHLLGHGRVWPRRQPRRRLVLLSCRCLYLCRRTGRRHWRIDTTLRTHFVVVD